jgi:hypothetical protein
MLFTISFSTCNRVDKRTVWILIRLRGCEGWSGSMLVANPLYVAFVMTRLKYIGVALQGSAIFLFKDIINYAQILYF